MKCPRCGAFIEYRMDFRSLSKSGKTMYFYFACKKCGVLFKTGERVRTYAELKKEVKP